MSIRTEIELRLAEFAESQTPQIPIAYENSKFTKPKVGPYIEIFLLGNMSVNRDLSANRRLYGKAQINVYAPLGGGMVILENLVSKVINLYPVIPKIGTVSIEQPCSEGASYVTDSFMCVPITVSYRVEL